MCECKLETPKQAEAVAGGDGQKAGKPPFVKE